MRSASGSRRCPVLFSPLGLCEQKLRHQRTKVSNPLDECWVVPCAWEACAHTQTIPMTARTIVNSGATGNPLRPSPVPYVLHAYTRQWVESTPSARSSEAPRPSRASTFDHVVVMDGASAVISPIDLPHAPAGWRGDEGQRRSSERGAPPRTRGAITRRTVFVSIAVALLAAALVIPAALRARGFSLYDEPSHVITRSGRPFRHSSPRIAAHPEVSASGPVAGVPL